jgi:hypothetical protein
MMPRLADAINQDYNFINVGAAATHARREGKHDIRA